MEKLVENMTIQDIQKMMWHIIIGSQRFGISMVYPDDIIQNYFIIVQQLWHIYSINTHTKITSMDIIFSVKIKIKYEDFISHFCEASDVINFYTQKFMDFIAPNKSCGIFSYPYFTFCLYIDKVTKPSLSGS